MRGDGLLKVCVNGSRTLADHPRLSSDAGDIAAEAAAGIAAGAAAVHVHAKSSGGRDSLLGTDVGRVLSAIRAACPGVPVGVTTGAWAAPEASDRIAAITSWRILPDFASVNWHEDGADEVAGALLAHGIGIEVGIWHERGLTAWAASPHRSSCLRALIEIQPDELLPVDSVAERLIGGVESREPELPILLHGEGTTAWPVLDLAAAWGYATRIGLEDTLVLPDGLPAESNSELVAEAVRRLASTCVPARV
ncbi:3-keto-5-aminohexanoate cleavage protein [Brevibacterium sp. W7.2]|jgi:uncharacterized protein (DUF849 family)|uniref:3-keto-5-aminohexanoate cleavage protein n=1 Tax=Brevibacterium sp. W7.2 TaxID=2823518 RepID=UPI001BA52AA5|nr:3-keto-5-aminohexanoate cleavage protein [Brevibacterium sp. W7.2]